MAIGTPVPKRPTRRAVAVIVALVVTTLTLLSMASKFLVDWVWFSAIGYPDVFWTLISTKAYIFVVVFIASAAVLLANGFVALRLAKHGRTTLPRRSLTTLLRARRNPMSSSSFARTSGCSFWRLAGYSGS